MIDNFIWHNRFLLYKRNILLQHLTAFGNYPLVLSLRYMLCACSSFPSSKISLKSWHLTVLITANQAEEIYNGVVREVKEETGVRNIFLEICKLIHLYSQKKKKKHLAFCDEKSAGVVHSWHTKGYYSIDTADWYRLCGSYCF